MKSQKPFAVVSGVACLLLAACGPTAVGAGAVPGADVQIPPIPPGAKVKHWQHFCVTGGFLPEGEGRFLDAAGSQGWELVTSEGMVRCFKRELLEVPAAPPAAAPQTPAPTATTSPTNGSR